LSGGFCDRRGRPALDREQSAAELDRPSPIATSLRGLDEAIRLAKPLHATLRIVHVVNDVLMDLGDVPTLTSASLIDALRESGKQVLVAAEAVARKQGAQFQGVLLETIGRRASELIVEDAKRWPADLIVMGTHGRRGLRRLALGSDAEMVLRSSPVPVLLIRETPEAC
jgi:nucleotide-binding universal stress UspA family protein